MASKSGIFCALQRIRNVSSFRRSLTVGRVIFNKAPSAPQHMNSVPDVPGLSANCVVVSEPVGPGASKTSGYKNPEYFCYSNMSYFEAEVEMLKYRCPQPSAEPTKPTPTK